MYYLIQQFNKDKPLMFMFESEESLKKHIIFNGINAKILTENVYFVHTKVEVYLEKDRETECGL